MFCLKVYLCCAFRKKLDRSHIYSLFFGNNGQHIPVCAKTISSWVLGVLHIAKAHISPSTLHGAEVSAAVGAVVADVFLVSILWTGDWARVSTAIRHYFSIYFTNTAWHQDSIQQVVLGLNE